MTANEPTSPVRCPTDEEAGPMISYHHDLPGFTVNAVKIGKHWHGQATRAGEQPITGIGATFEDALDVVKRRYEERDGWPLGPERLDPHRGTSAAWRRPVEPRVPPAACKLAGQPAPFAFDPMQDLDRALARARKARRETFDAAGRWIADRWLGLVVFAAIVIAVGAVHWEWPR